MQNNLYIGPDAKARFALTSLRAHEESGPIAEGRTPIVEGIAFVHDAGPGLTGQYRATSGNMLGLSLSSVSHPQPGWQCLTVALGPMNLTGAAVIGVVLRTQAPQSTVTRITLRSGREQTFVDQSFDKAMVSFSQASTHVDMIEIASAPYVPIEADWRDLMLFFRPGSLEIDILDLRFFVV